MRRRGRGAMQQADGRPATASARQNRPAHEHWQRIKQLGGGEAGVEHDEADVYTEYRDLTRSFWNTIVLPALRKVPLVTLERMFKGRLSRRALINIRAGRSTPHRRNQELLASIVRKLGLL